MAIRNLRTEAEYEDSLGYNDLVNMLSEEGPSAPATALSSEPATAQTAFNPVGFDWSKGEQNIGGTIYAPRFDIATLKDEFGNSVLDEYGLPVRLMQGEGEAANYVQGPALTYAKYKESDKKPGGFYEVYDISGKLLGYEPFVEEDFGRGGFFEDIFGQAKNIAVETAPLWTMAVGAGPLAGTIGSAAASGLGITGLSAAQTAALGSAIAGGANTALQGGNLGDVLKGAAATALPSFVLHNIPSTGTPVLDKAIQAGTQAAIRGGDVKSVVTSSLLNSGLGSAVGETGLDPKLVNAVVQLAQSGGDPQKLFNAFVTGASGLSRPTAGQAASAGYGGADQGFFDPDAETSPLPDWALDPYAQETKPGEYYAGLDKIVDEWDEADIIPDTYDTGPRTSMSPNEMAQFLEANIDDPGTINMLMQDYFPELYAQRIETTAKRQSPSDVIIPVRDVLPDAVVPTPTPAPSPGPSPSPAPKSSTPGKAPTPSPAPKAAKPGMDIGALFAILDRMGGQQPTQAPAPYQTARINTESPFGLMYGLES